MMTKTINIEYLTSPEGDDFASIDEFVRNIDHTSFLTITKGRADACGGGWYDLIVKITEDISILELAKSYAQDGAKILIGVTLASLLKELKILFNRNKKLKPSLDGLVLEYLDCKVIIYSLYVGSIEKSIQEILEELCKFHSKNKSLFETIDTIHIPILYHKDAYNLCDYRVKLYVDEPITHFKKSDYFKFWGVTIKNEDTVYDIANSVIKKDIFYTQESYNELFLKACSDGKI